ncbi:MAG: UDP-3-O-(3-hydroxymyristoyl)glucosamine N-acyltransferase [Saprospiraceae bacterium]
MQLSAQEIAQLLNGTVEGNPAVLVSGPSKIEEGGEGTITFLARDNYEEYAYTTTASVLLVSRTFIPKKPITATLIRVDNVYNALSFLLERFGNQLNMTSGVDKTAFVHPDAQLASDVSVGRFSVIEANVQIGAGSYIGDQVYLGKDVTIGKNAVIYPGVKIMYGCRIGDNCVLHSNVVIGSDGFGFAPQEDGSYKKIPQTGNVVIEHNVEIGANCTIDRASIGSTIIRSGVKMDNLVQIAHNVEIGENTVIAAQVGVAGSTKIGKNCRIGGQVGFVGHITVADGTQIQAQSGIASNIKEPNTALFGYPAFAYNDFVRSHAIFKKLPELYKKISELERQINGNKKDFNEKM